MSEQPELSIDSGSPPKAKKAATKKAPAKKRATATRKKAADSVGPTGHENGDTKPATRKTAARKTATKKAARKAPVGDELFPPAPEVAGVDSTPKKRATNNPAKKAVVKKTAKAAGEPAPKSKAPPSEEKAPRSSSPEKRADEVRGNSDAREDKPESQPERSERPSDREDRRGDRGRDRDRRRSSDRGDRGPDRAPENRDSDRRRSDDSGDRDRNRDRDRQPRDDRNGGGDGGEPRQRDQERDGDYATRNRNRRKRWKDRKRERRRDFGPRPGGSESGEEEREPPPEVPLGPPEPSDGVLEISPKGFGYLRRRELRYAQHPQDAYVPADLIRKLGLREGMRIVGEQCKGQRGPVVTTVKTVNERSPDEIRNVPLFEELKAVNPNKRLQMETTPGRMTTRVIDMVTPIGRGQRGLIVAPPRAGKTTLLQHIAEAVVENHPQMHLIILLVDERPEEVTEFKRILPQAELFASSNDMDVASHLRIAQFAIERAKRLVEMGEHVFILMDSITRMARAFNNASKKGATMSGGMGVGALEIPRRLFAAARNTRTAGSLTILATALVETGSRMDDLIFQEFKGTGNLELVLDRRIAEQFFYPAVDIFKSGTRREELLLQGFQLEKIRMLRRGLAGHKPIEALQRVLTLLERYPSNAQMLVDLPSK